LKSRLEVNHDAQPLFDEAVRLYKCREWTAARKILILLPEIDPQSPAIYSTLGLVCWEIGLLNEAAEAFRRAIRLKPAFEAASLGLFQCLWRLDKRDEALEEAKRFLSIADSAEYDEIIREINEKL